MIISSWKLLIDIHCYVEVILSNDLLCHSPRPYAHTVIGVSELISAVLLFLSARAAACWLYKEQDTEKWAKERQVLNLLTDPWSGTGTREGSNLFHSNWAAPCMRNIPGRDCVTIKHSHSGTPTQERSLYNASYSGLWLKSYDEALKCTLHCPFSKWFLEHVFSLLCPCTWKGIKDTKGWEVM